MVIVACAGVVGVVGAAGPTGVVGAVGVDNAGVSGRVGSVTHGVRTTRLRDHAPSSGSRFIGVLKKSSLLFNTRNPPTL